jgi:hypothetical protein
VTQPIAGCPSPNYIAPPFEVSADVLDANILRGWMVGMGDTAATSCGGLPGNGFFNANPTFTLDMSGFDNGWSEFRIRTTANCQLSILMRDAQGNWYAEEEGRSDNRLRVNSNLSNLNGLVSIWVGVESLNSCNSWDEIRIDAND